MDSIPRRAASILLLSLIAATAFPDQGRAQSNLSAQGYGFPPGQFSARAYGAGGSIAEMDPLSPINPASIAQFGTRLIFFQIEPEFRTVSTANGSERTTTSRYPDVFGAVPLGSNWVISLGASTLLDRTATTIFNSTQFLNGTDSVPMTTQFKVDGAMDDIRLAGAWSSGSWLKLGLGLHAITGHNLISITQSFVDSAQFAAFTQQRILSFGGTAVSAGAELSSKDLTLAFSGRYGGPVHLLAEDTLLDKARVPNRWGASLAYTGIANSAIAVRTSRDYWSSLGTLGDPGLHAVDTWDTSVGADIAGPRIGDRIVFLRGGYRTRTLPFPAAGSNVRENSITGGIGTSFANARVLTDLALIHADRNAGIDASEHAWTISIGISVRP